MARVTIVRQWSTGDAIKVTVAVDESYPDALDQARATAHREMTEACAYVVDE